MKKFFATLGLAIFLIASLLIPNLVKAQLEPEAGLEVLAPKFVATKQDSSIKIHPGWVQWGLVPGCH